MLTDAQRKAVETEATQAVVVAGAGSGKTRVLTRRVLHLLRDKSVSPSEVMVVTFTRKAAGELQARLMVGLDSPGADVPHLLDGLRCGTFHSLAFDFLRAGADHLGYDQKTLTVVEPDDADELLKQVCRDLGYLKANGKWKSGFSWKQVNGLREAMYCQPSGSALSISGSIVQMHVLREYWSRLKQLNALDYGLILTECLALFKKQKGGQSESWSKMNFHWVRHILVDEAQDCNPVQHEFIKAFSPPASVFLVGDYRQSIYGFRGAEPKLMRNAFPDAEIITLSRTFRCADQIIEAATCLIDRDPSCPNPMVGATGRAGETRVWPGRSATLKGLIIGVRRTGGFAYSDIAVLARNHRTLNRLGDILGEVDIPFHHVGTSFDVCKSEPFKVILAALKLVVNPRDDLAFARLRKVFGLSDAEYGGLRTIAAERGVSHWEECQRADLVIERRGVAFLRPLLDAEPGDDATALVNGIEGFIDDDYPALVATFWMNHCSDMTVAQALQWFSLRDSQDDLAEGDVVTLSTVHAAKGLEWPVVIVWGLNEGTFPSSQSLKDDKAVQEERRVCYVAFTRAKEALYVHYRRAEDQSERGKIQLPSRFLSEAGLFAPEPELVSQNDEPGPFSDPKVLIDPNRPIKPHEPQ